MTGMDHDNSDVLAAEPRRKGGLVRSDNVSATLAAAERSITDQVLGCDIPSTGSSIFAVRFGQACRGEESASSCRWCQI